MWLAFYALQLLMVSTACGLAFVRHAYFPVPQPYARFGFGFALSPFLLGALTLGLSLILPGQPAFIYVLLPLVLALGYIAYFFKVEPEFWTQFRRFFQSVCQRALWFEWVVSGLCVIILAGLLFKISAQSAQPWRHHDSLIYANEALTFAQHRDLAHVPDFHEPSPDKVMPGHPHSFLYQSYLSQALMAAPQNQIGYPFDVPARFANEILVFYLFVALFVLGVSTGFPLVGLMAITFLPTVRNLQHMVYASSRDAFRIIPLLLLASCLLLTFREESWKKSLLWLLGVCTCSALLAHTLNAVIVPIMGGTWLLCALYFRLPWKKTLGFFGASTGGLLLGGLHYAKSYLDTGNVWGYGFDFYAFQNTPLYEALLSSYKYTFAYKMSLSTKMLYILRMDYYTTSSLALMCSVLVLLWALIRRENSFLQASMTWLALFIVAAFLPMAGFLDWGKHNLSKMFIINFRYILFLFPFLAVFKGWVLKLVYDQKSIIRYVTVPVVVMLFVLSFRNVTQFRVDDQDIRGESPYQVGQALKSLPRDARVILDNSGTGYYVEQPSLGIYTRPVWPVLRAQNPQDMLRALNALQTPYIVLEDPAKGWWESSYLYDFLNQEKYARVLQRGERWTLYQIQNLALKPNE